MLIVYRNIATGSTWFAAGCKKDRWTSVDVDYQGKFFFATVWPLLAFTTIPWTLNFFLPRVAS